MNTFNIIYKHYDKYAAIVYPVSYHNPIEDIHSVSVELKKHLITDCYILFDLLLSNGNNFNRFAEGYYDGNDIKLNTINVIEIPSDKVHELDMYYHGKTKELNKSVLSAKEKFRFAITK